MSHTESLDLTGMERGPLEGRTILVTGASRGTGLALASDLHYAGAEIIAVVRSKESYSRILQEIGNQRIHPFMADLTKREQIDQAVEELNNHPYLLTDVIQCAASGMESFAKRAGLGLARLARIDVEKRDEAFQKFKEDSQKWVEESIPLAKAVNYEGPRYLTKKLVKRLPEEANIIDFSSLYSTFSDSVWVPAFYQGISSTKANFEKFLEEDTELKKAEVNITIVSGHIIEDTDIGKAFIRLLLPLLPEDQQEAMRSTFISKQDMVNATLEALEGKHFNPRQRFRRLYVHGPGGQISTKLSSSSPIFSYTLPL